MKDNIMRTAGYTLSLFALCGLSFTPMASAFAAEGNGSAENDDPDGLTQESDAKVPAEKENETIGTAAKDETVFVFCAADGQKKNIEVSNTITNKNGLGYIMDNSQLSDIVSGASNVNFTQNGESVLWDAQGEDVCYSGTTNKALPVTFTAHYYVDGQQVSSSQLAGATGQVRIVYTFKNHSRVVADGRYVNTPFLAATVFAFDPEVAKNIQVTNGKVLELGGQQVVIGYALPGMQDNLGVSSSEFEVPDSFEVTFDATDFHYDGSYTMVTSSLFDDVDVDGIDLGGVTDSLGQLSDAMEQLVDGSAALAEGMDQFQTQTAELPDGVAALNDGAGQLADGLPQAQDGAQQLADGTATLESALDAMRNGTDTATGMVDAVNSIGTKDDTAATTLQGGINQIRAGLSKMKGELNAEDPTQSSGSYLMLVAAQGIAQATAADTPAEENGLYQGTKSTLDGVSTLLTMADTKCLKPAQDGVSLLSATLTEKLPALTEGLEGALTAVGTAAEAAGTAAEAAGEIASGIQDASGALADAGSSVAAAAEQATIAQNQSQAAADALDAIDTEGMSAEQKAAIETAKKAADAAESAASSAAGDASDAGGSVTDAVGALQGASGSVTTMASAAQTAATAAQTAGQTANALAEAAGQLPDASSIKDLSTALATARAMLTGDGVQGNPSAKTVIDTYEPQLLGGISKINSTANQLAAGITGDGTAENPGVLGAISTLDQGLESLQEALSLLRDGGTAPDGREGAGLSGAVDGLGTEDDANTLIGGVAALNAGADQLAGALGDAADGAGQIADGTQTLSDSVPALMDGISQLADGSSQLASGTSQFNEEGIQKLVSLFGDTIGDLGGRLQSIKAAGTDYRTFSGAAANADSTVKFIYKTDAIG